MHFVILRRATLPVAFALACLAGTALAQEGVFLSEEDAPRAVFADADGFTRQVLTVSPELRDQIRAALGTTQPSVWEDQYVVFTARRDNAVIGHAIIVEEVGKHRPITFVVSVGADDSVGDVAVMAYREAYGGEVQSRRFLKQYHGKRASNDLRSYGEIQNIAGATLSVDAASRAVKKALAVARVAFGSDGALAAQAAP